MRYFLALFTWVLLISCKENQQNPNNQYANNSFEFKEIGNKIIQTTSFPPQWKVHIYEELPTITKKDSLLQATLEGLNYFDDIKGKKSNDYVNILKEKNQKIDLLYVIDSISNGNLSFVYIKTIKKSLEPNYDFPPIIREIDVLIYNKKTLKSKLNIYSEKNYPFAVDLKLGYLDKQGNLYSKHFQQDEENTTFILEKHQKINDTGNIILISEKKPKVLEKSNNKTEQSVSNNMAGSYYIKSKAVSNYDQEEIYLEYFITVKSSSKAILSIGADQVQDYGCEGEYKLMSENGITLAKGKCDQDDIDDFYLKQESNKYYIKSKRFINQDWQELKLNN